MAYLRTTASLLDFAFECNRIKKLLSNLKNMNLTPQETIEYLERMIATMLTDSVQVGEMVKAHANKAPLGLNTYIHKLNNETQEIAVELLYSMRELVTNLQKLDATK
jgi:hypothetical protein